ncbi:MAG: hypothetical protein M1840_004447 [Geoglossum simile]|nr:MAG: hypothetical protein M1840_004447 [Geoglossum simile]
MPKHAMPSQHRQRKITPSSEKIIPTNTMFISPKKHPSTLPINAAIPKSLVPNTNEAKIEINLPSASSMPFAGPLTELGKAIQTSRYIIFDFSLVEDRQPRSPRTEEMLNAAIHYFDTQTNVRIAAIRWSIDSWRIVIPDGTSLDSLPIALAGNLCGYIFKSKNLESTKAAYRLKEPSSTIARDDSAYADLRPGIMLSSARFEGIGSVPAREELLTSFGVLVKDAEDNQYMTVMSHRFPIGEEDVYHNSSNGVIIGDLEKRLDTTDIALVKL